MADGFTPADPRQLHRHGDGAPRSFGPPNQCGTMTFRVIAAAGGGGTGDPVQSGRPGQRCGIPSRSFRTILRQSSLGCRVPQPDVTGVQTTVFPQVTFTEPVKHIAQHVLLQRADGTNVPFVLRRDGPDGPIRHDHDRRLRSRRR